MLAVLLGPPLIGLRDDYSSTARFRLEWVGVYLAADDLNAALDVTEREAVPERNITE